MDRQTNPDASCSHKRPSKMTSKSNKDHRLRADKRENYPNGYVEEWLLPSDSTMYENSEHRSNYEINDSFQLTNESIPDQPIHYGFIKYHRSRKHDIAIYSEPWDELKTPESSVSGNNSNYLYNKLGIPKNSHLVRMSKVPKSYPPVATIKDVPKKPSGAPGQHPNSSKIQKPVVTDKKPSGAPGQHPNSSKIQNPLVTGKKPSGAPGQQPNSSKIQNPLVTGKKPAGAPGQHPNSSKIQNPLVTDKKPAGAPGQQPNSSKIQNPLVTDKKPNNKKLVQSKQTPISNAPLIPDNIEKEVGSGRDKQVYLVDASEAKSLSYHPVSIILSTQDNIVLNKENGYEIRFSTGMLEGKGISINETGNIITFQDDGSYRFEICGEAALFSDVDVNLVYDSDNFLPDIKQFSTVTIPKDEGKLQLRGIPTILPLQKNQTIIPKLIPSPDESIVLIGGTRLLIHRVA